MKKEEFYTPDQVHLLIGGIIAASTIKRWAREEKLEHCKIGNRYFFTEKHVTNLIEKLKIVPTQPLVKPKEKEKKPPEFTEIDTTKSEDVKLFGGTVASIAFHEQKQLVAH